MTDDALTPPRRDVGDVAVTGAGGYLGRHVVRSLLDLGYGVRAVVRRESTEIDARATVVIADVLAPQVDLAEVLGPDPVALVHLAWEDGFVHDSPVHMERVSAHYSFLVRAADQVARIVALGTMHEVGYWHGAVGADTPTAPRTQYGIAKDALRRSLSLQLRDSSEFCWARCFYITGDDDRSRSVFAAILRAAQEGRREMPFTSGTSRFDFIDVAELGRQLAVLAVAFGVTGTVNCGSGRPTALRDRVLEFIAENDLDVIPVFGALPDRATDSPAVWADATEILRLVERSALSGP